MDEAPPPDAVPGPVPTTGGDATPSPGAPLVALSAAFFLTGATALATEVVLTRLMTYVFGSSHAATATVLAAYMCGLSLGSLLFGARARRMARPVAAYGRLQLAIALFLALLPALFTGFREAGLALAQHAADTPTATALLRFAMSFAFVLVPTVMMGGTLPVLLAAFDARDALSRRLPWLYAVNTLGAATGTLLSAYVGIEALGLDGMAFACALVDGTVGVVCMALASRRPARAVVDAAPATPEGGGPDAAPRLAMALAFGQGMTVFTLEVVWAHLIATVLGTTVYAFATMLGVILLGVGFGSLGAEAASGRLARAPLTGFAWGQAALALVVMLARPLWDRFPIVVNLTLDWQPAWSFAARELVRFGFAVSLLFPACLAMGFSLPALAMTGRRPGVDASSWAGRLFAANTAGAIVGAIGCGFLLLGRLSSEAILAVAALMASVLCALALGRAGGEDAGPFARRAPLAAVGAAGLCLALLPGWDIDRLTAGNHMYWRRWVPGEAGRIVFFEEDAQVGFVTVNERDGIQHMRTNGKYEGSDGAGEFQDLFALLSDLYLPRPGRAALVGLGVGRTMALLHEMGLQGLEVIDYSPAVIRAAREAFPEITRGPLADPAVEVVCEDGRNHILLATRPYDLVVIGITSASYAGVGSFYSRDFFAGVRDRLAPGGVFVTWLQLHHVPPREVVSAIFTLRTVFPHLHVYATPGNDHAYLVASASPLVARFTGDELPATAPRTRRVLQAMGMRSTRDVAAWAALTTDEELLRLFSVLKPAPLTLTDFALAFEYATPRGLAAGIEGFDLRAYSAARLPSFERGLDPGEALGLQGLLFAYHRRYPEALAMLEASERQLGRSLWPGKLAALRATLQRPPAP